MGKQRFTRCQSTVGAWFLLLLIEKELVGVGRQRLPRMARWVSDSER